MTAVARIQNEDDPHMAGLVVTRTAGYGECNGRCLVGKQGYEIMALVNRQFAAGASVNEVYEILASLPGTTYKNNKVPSPASLSNHRKNHLPINVRAYAKILERRAIEQGKIIEEGADNFVTHIGMSEVIGKIGFNDIIEGRIKLSAKDTLEAIKLTAQFEKESSNSFDAVAAMAQVQKIMSAVQRVVPADMWTKILIELARDEDIEDAVIVEDDDEWGDGS